MKEARFAMLARSKPEASARLLELAQEDINARWHFYEQLAGVERRGTDRRPQGTATAKTKRKEVNIMSVDLTTKYLGLNLKNPLVIAACPLTQQARHAACSWKRRARPPPCSPRSSRSRSRTTSRNDPRPRVRHGELRRVAHLLPRGGRLPRRPGKLSGAHRQGQAGGEDSRSSPASTAPARAAGSATRR